MKTNTDNLIDEINALKEVGVLDAKAHKAAVAYVHNHEEELEKEMANSAVKVSEFADTVVLLSKDAKKIGNPQPYKPAVKTTAEKENDMAPKGKKAKGKKGKKVAARKAAPRTKTANGEAVPRVTIANFIRAELEKQGKDYDAKKIAEKAAEKFPDKKPTAGYVNWISEHAPKVSTTTSPAA